ncbi:predicted protein [Fibroporia radiculosa]|uniref:Uncharacterized protein n=1 Tax=Fibroporia radiculosa TaxID=599839 RepID=J4GXE2_9APHY|nr:predicted protein [Fibroporia radiculosa]
MTSLLVRGQWSAVRHLHALSMDDFPQRI